MVFEIDPPWGKKMHQPEHSKANHWDNHSWEEDDYVSIGLNIAKMQTVILINFPGMHVSS